MLNHRRLNRNLKRKTQSPKQEEDSMLGVSSWTTGTQNSIQEKSIFTHVLITVVGDLDSTANEEQNIMAEEYLKNNIILDSGP